MREVLDERKDHEYGSAEQFVSPGRGDPDPSSVPVPSTESFENREQLFSYKNVLFLTDRVLPSPQSLFPETRPPMSLLSESELLTKQRF